MCSCRSLLLLSLTAAKSTWFSLSLAAAGYYDFTKVAFGGPMMIMSVFFLASLYFTPSLHKQRVVWDYKLRWKSHLLQFQMRTGCICICICIYKYKWARGYKCVLSFRPASFFPCTGPRRRYLSLIEPRERKRKPLPSSLPSCLQFFPPPVSCTKVSPYVSVCVCVFIQNNPLRAFLLISPLDQWKWRLS